MSYTYPYLINYPFAGEIEDSKIVTLYCADVIRGGADQFRNEVGNYWWKYTPDDNNATIEHNILPVETDILDIRRQMVSRMGTDSNYIEKIEFNPYKITSISNDVYVPNYKIPMRMYASETETMGDKFWQILFKGGKWGEQTYKSIIDDKSIFYDEAFSFEIPYSVMETKMTLDIVNADNVYHANPKYVYYNENTAKYQKWAHSLESELLMPFWYLYSSVNDHLEWLSTTDYDDVTPSSARENRIFWQQNECFFEYWRPAARASEIYSPEPPPPIPIPEIPAEDAFIYDTITINLLNNVVSETSRGENEDYIVNNIQHFDELSQTTRNKVIERCKNIIFPHEYFHFERDQGLDLEKFPQNQSLEQVFPYYNKIKFPRTKEVGDGFISLTETISRNYTIRDSIADNNFSAKFLETLKDIHNGEFTTTKFGTKTFISEKSYMSGSNMYGGSGTKEFNDLGHTRLRALDLTYMVSEIYNQHGSSLNNDYYIAGPSNESYEATYTDVDLFRFSDNQNALEVLKDVSEMLQRYMKVGGPGMFGLPIDDSIFSVEHTGADVEGSTAYAFSPAKRVPDDPISSATLLESFLNPSYKHTEVLAYRIEKKRANRLQGQTSRETIQNFWMFNSPAAGDDMILWDTQVKYDQDYTYIGYAYMMVLGHRYRYGDYRLTKQIATIDVGSDETDEVGAEYYCLQFYDPKTEEFADQIFFNGTGAEPGEEVDVLSSLLATGVTGLPESANAFATSRQELSVHPQLAECHLYIEPCLKLIEIPIFSKTFKVLDNPANDMITIPFQYIDNSHRVGFNTIYESFMEEPYPQIVTDEDRKIKSDYLHANDLLSYEDVLNQSESPPRFVQVFRIEKPPATLSDFAGHLRDTADLIIEDSPYTYSQAVLNDKLIPNKKYYYLFRFLNENKMPGQLSQILECELVDDGGYIYSTFNTVEDSDMKKESYVSPNMTFKKVIQLQPHISQLTLDTSEVDFSAPAGTQLTELKIGVTDEQLWDKTFKLRLTSKKTGKQLDLNVTYKLKSENKFSSEPT